MNGENSIVDRSSCFGPIFLRAIEVKQFLTDMSGVVGMQPKNEGLHFSNG